MEWPPKHRWEYTCTPELNPVFKALDLALHYPWMKRFIFGELSHAWHYRPKELNERILQSLVLVDGDPNATPAEIPFGVTIGHLGGWKRGRIIQPANPNDSERFHYVFSTPEKDSLTECTIDLLGPAIVKVGRKSFYAGLIDSGGNPIKTRVSEPVNISDRSIPWPRI